MISTYRQRSTCANPYLRKKKFSDVREVYGKRLCKTFKMCALRVDAARKSKTPRVPTSHVTRHFV
jgi:hypothetical protein